MSEEVPVEGVHIILHRMLTVSYTKSVLAVLLYKRTLDVPVFPGYWGTIGGKRDKHDPSAEFTALREMKEELDIVVERGVMKQQGTVPTNNMQGDNVAMMYFTHRLERDMHQLTLRWNAEHNKVEGEGLGWFTAEETKKMLLRPEDREAVDRFFSEHGG